jgi:hypothetical protein
MLWCLNEAIASARELIVWGGSDFYTINTAGRYEPSIHSWTGITITNALTEKLTAFLELESSIRAKVAISARKDTAC